MNSADIVLNIERGHQVDDEEEH
ncbi:unnamed protein product, partial [Rotaria magnacalcarata]